MAEDNTRKWFRIIKEIYLLYGKHFLTVTKFGTELAQKRWYYGVFPAAIIGNMLKYKDVSYFIQKNHSGDRN